MDSIEEQRLSQRRAQVLPWIADPLTHLFHEEHEHKKVPSSENEKSDGHEDKEEDAKSILIAEKIETEEAEPLELFYDLFFVANLTTVTAVHYVVDHESLVSYVLFFIILWFTWLQTTLYDIRFSVDSVYERTVKIAHFGVMIGFAATTLTWNPLNPKILGAAMNLRSMSLTLMASRFAFGIEYGVAACYTFKHNKKGLYGLTIHSIAMFCAAVGYLALYFEFRTHHTTAYRYWYLIIGIELVIVLGASTIWKVIGFKRTHLVERMGLLTLIIIGEGIIVMLKAVNAVEKGAAYGAGWGGSTFAIVTASIGVIYGFYMFYFDYTPRGVHYGSIRQQFWTVLHFPFHLTIVLSVEGLRQLATYWSFIESRNVLSDRWQANAMASDDPAGQWIITMKDVEYFFDYLYDDGTSISVVKNYGRIQEILGNLTLMPFGPTTREELKLYDYITYYASRGHAEFYGIKIPKVKSYGALKDDDFDPELPIQKLYELVFEYFFLSVGLVFFMYGFMGIFVRRKKDFWDYFSILLRFVTGAIIICIERVKTNPNLYYTFVNSPWPIPTVCLLMYAILFIDKAVGTWAYRRLKYKMQLGKFT